MEFEFAKLGERRLAELPSWCIFHDDEFKLRSFDTKPWNKRNECHAMEAVKILVSRPLATRWIAMGTLLRSQLRMEVLRLRTIL